MTSRKERNKNKQDKGFESRTRYHESYAPRGFHHFKETTRPETRPLFEAFKQRSMLPFKPATLYNAGGDTSKEWYIQYYYFNNYTGKYQRFKETFDVNRIKVPAEKIKYANEAVRFINERLQDGYNPFEEKKLVTAYKHNCIEQLQQVVDNLIAVSTKNAGETYRLMFNRFKKYLAAKKIEDIPAVNIDINICTDLQRYLVDDCKLARKTVNATTSHLGILFDELKAKKIITENSFRILPAIKSQRGRKKESRKDIFEPITAKELAEIIKHLSKNNQRPFLRFLGFVYYAWARPIEIMRLRVRDIDMENKAIIFRKEETKNDKPAVVQMLQPLFQLLTEIDLKKYPGNFYLFSIGFLPGTKMLNQRYHVNDLWYDEVKEKLQINKNLYALKHTGNIEYLIKNRGHVDVKWQQRQNRHSSVTQTEKYIRALGVYFIDTEQVKFTSFI